LKQKAFLAAGTVFLDEPVFRVNNFFTFFQKPLSGVCKERLSAPRWRGEGIYAEARKSQQLFSNKNNKHLNTLNS
jgi:hypothetical protein